MTCGEDRPRRELLTPTLTNGSGPLIRGINPREMRVLRDAHRLPHRLAFGSPYLGIKRVRRVEDLIARESRVKKFRLSESAHRDRPLTTAAAEELKNFGSDGRVIDRGPRKKRDVIPLGIFERPYVEERHPQKRTILRL